jgi:hypothetical protein
MLMPAIPVMPNAVNPNKNAFFMVRSPPRVMAAG